MLLCKLLITIIFIVCIRGVCVVVLIKALCRGYIWMRDSMMYSWYQFRNQILLNCTHILYYNNRYISVKPLLMD